MADFTELQFNEFGAKINNGKGKLLQLLDRYVNFVNNDYPVIVNFFNGNLDFVKTSHVTNLKVLVEDFDDLSNNIMLNGFKFSTYMDWEIVEYLESLKMELYRMTKTSKFLRSSKTNYNFTGKLEIPSTLKQNQTLEDVSFNIQGEPEYGNKWIDLAIRNDLSELDYTLRGDQRLIIGFQVSSRIFNIKSVVDNIIGERILGLDIDRVLQFVDDDLLVLSYNNTAKQSVEILANLRKGTVPEFKEFGVSNMIGVSVKSMSIGTVVREMYTVFSSDDSLARFSVKEFSQVGTDASLTFEVSTRLGEVITQSISI